MGYHGGEKLDKQPRPRGPRRDSYGEIIPRRRSETKREVRRLKRMRPDGVSLKEFMRSLPEGKAWLKRKKQQ